MAKTKQFNLNVYNKNYNMKKDKYISKRMLMKQKPKDMTFREYKLGAVRETENPNFTEDEISTAINPCALAEQIEGRRIDWDKEGDREKLLAKILGAQNVKDIYNPKKSFLCPIRRSFSPSGKSVYKTSGVEGTNIPEQIAGVYTPLKNHSASEEINFKSDDSWMPSDVGWKKVGSYYINGAEALEIDQGPLGDCYFLAALSSAGWVNKNLIKSVDKNGTHTMTFYTWLKKAEKVSVSEEIPCSLSENTPAYGSSTTSGETWPAVWEKAYAKWDTGCSNDHPNILKIAGGNGGTALRQITGKGYSYYYLYNLTSRLNTVWSWLDKNTDYTGKTLTPMVVNTSSIDREDSLGIVSSHVYSVLGIETVNKKKRIILRNPWAWKEPKKYCREGSWNGLKLNTNGVFSIEFERFLEYFYNLYYV